ncbi:LmeA family phospholipid-binding protein [Streptomyces thermolilacinus]|uniref:LmeA family phospholipid-binding protein n=1 Tax=Streptomyces thermolilacinus TaxID=285540 RepID=UPI0033E798B5
MRALRTLLIIAVVLGGLFTIADRLAVAAAEGEAADRIQARQGLSTAPDVSIRGFPFLTQVMGGELDQVDVAMTGVEATAGGRTVRVGELNAELRGVRLENGYSRAVAASATGTARISYEELRKASDNDVVLGYGGDGKLKVTGSIELLGRKVTRSVLSTVSVVDGDTLRVRADKVPGEGIPGVEELVRERTDFDREVKGFPAGLKIQRVEATPDGLQIAVTGQNVVLAG